MWKGHSMHDLASTITAVTVFRQGAEIVRQAALPPGEAGAVKVGGLPLAMLDHAVTLRVQGSEPRPVVVDYRIGLQVNAATELGHLDRKVKEAEDRNARLQARESSLQSLRQALEALEPQGRPQSSEGAPLGSYHLRTQLDLLAFRDAQTAALEDELAQVGKELEEASEILIALRHQRDQQAPAARPEALEKVLHLTLRGSVGPGTVLLVEYRVPGARWTPAYSVSFSALLDKAQLTMRAMLAQKTGEDWSSVNLTLSTADPNEWRDVPQWKSLRIGQAQEPDAVPWFAPPTGTDLLFADYDAIASGSVGATDEASASPIKYAPPPPPPPDLDMCYPEESCDDEMLAGEGGGGGEAGAAAMPLQAAPAPQPMDKARRSRTSFGAPPSGTMARGGFGQAEMEPPQEARVETRLTVDETVRRYQSLRLADISSPERGRLITLEQVEEYRQSATVTWSRTEIAAALQQARTACAQIDGGGPPAGHSYPQAQSGFDFSYQAEAPVDLVGDGAFHSVPVFAIDLQPSIDYVCTPRESQQVFRTAHMTAAGRALPEGPADVSVGGDFLHTTPLRGVTPEGILSLGLGVEQSIKVSRNASFKEGTSGLMGGTTELTHSVTVEAVNHRAQGVMLEVRERLPQPAPEHKDEMKVLLGTVQPPWESFVPDENPSLASAYRWKLPLPAGHKASATMTYIVEMASKNELQGGNRREPRS
jgi:hypothetical protein